MKFLIVILLTTFLLFACSNEEEKRANDLFYEASQTQSSLAQMRLLEESLNTCFSYEVKYTILNIKAQNTKSVKEKITLYRSALETVSFIENQKDRVISEQNRINKMLSILYKGIDKEISDIYKNKVQEKSSIRQASNAFKYSFFGAVILLIIFAFYIIFRKK